MCTKVGDDKVCAKLCLRNPFPEAKYRQCEQMEDQQEEVKPSINEQPLGQKAPVDCPLEHEDAAHFNGSGKVGCGVCKEERQAWQQLND